MKSLSIFIVFLLGIIMLYPTEVTRAVGKSDEALLKNIDAMRAVEIANE